MKRIFSALLLISLSCFTYSQTFSSFGMDLQWTLAHYQKSYEGGSVSYDTRLHAYRPVPGLELSWYWTFPIKDRWYFELEPSLNLIVVFDSLTTETRIGTGSAYNLEIYRGENRAITLQPEIGLRIGYFLLDNKQLWLGLGGSLAVKGYNLGHRDWIKEDYNGFVNQNGEFVGTALSSNGGRLSFKGWSATEPVLYVGPNLRYWLGEDQCLGFNFDLTFMVLPQKEGISRQDINLGLVKRLGE